MKLAYTVAEAAELCGISERQMRRLIAEGSIYAAPMGDLRIGHVELERYLLGHPREVATVAPTAVATPEPAPVRRRLLELLELLGGELACPGVAHPAALRRGDRRHPQTIFPLKDASLALSALAGHSSSLLEVPYVLG